MPMLSKVPRVVGLVLTMLGVVCIAGMTWFAVDGGPELILRRQDSGWSTLKALDKLQLEASLRVGLLQAVAALLLLMGAVTAVRQLRLSRLQASMAHRTQSLEMYARACEQLASAEEFIRLGGVQVLVGLSTVSDIREIDVVSLLCQFARDRSRDDQARTSVEAAIKAASSLNGAASALDLRSTKLFGFRFDEADLRLVNFTGSDLRESTFKSADLAGAILTNADVSRADFTGANLTNARLDVARRIGTIAL
jgi:hypothetical protein